MTRNLPVPAALALGATFLAGCTVFPESEPPRVMDLAVPDHGYRAEAPRPESLRVGMPHASGIFDSTHILAKPSPLEFRIYPDVRWQDTIPVMVRDLLLEAHRTSNGFAHVVYDISQTDTDWTLVSELSSFHTENYDGGPKVVIRLHAQILSNRSRNTLCSKSFRVVEEAAGETAEQAVAAFSSAGGTLSEAVARWAVECPGNN